MGIQPGDAQEVSALQDTVVHLEQQLAQHQQALAYRLRERELVYHLSADLAAAREATTIYHRALDAVIEVLNADRASLLLFDADGVMRFKAWRGLSAHYRACVEGHSPWTQDEQDPQPITVPDVLLDPSLHGLDDVMTGEGIRALAFIPLVYKRQLLGKFMAYFDSPHTFSNEEVWLAQTVANHIAISIERQRTDQVLQESEAKFRSIFDKAPNGIVLIGADGNWLDVNPALCQMLGYSRDQLVGGRSARFIAPEQDSQRQVIHQRLEQQGYWRGEFSLVRSDGEWVYLDWHVSLFPESGVRLAVASDISERKRQEARTAAEHAITRTLADADSFEAAVPSILTVVRNSLGAQIGELWLPDEKEESLYCALSLPEDESATWAEFIERSREIRMAPGQEMPGQIWQTGTPLWIANVQADERFVRSEYAAAIGLQSSLAFPILNSGKCLGGFVFHATHCRPPEPALMDMLSSLGNEIGQFVQRWRAEAALRKSETFKNLMLQSSQDCIKVLDCEGHLLWMNDGGQKLLDIDDFSTVANTNWLDFWQGEDRSAAQQAIADASDGGTGRFVGYSPTQTGKPKWWDVLITPLQQEDGSPLHLLSISRDITARKESEAEREQLLSALTQERAKLETRVRERTQQVRRLAAELSLAEHQERKRVSQILHDHVQQMLYAVQMRSYLIGLDMPEQSSALLQNHLQEMKHLTDDAIRATRTLTVELSPPVLENEGLPEALAWLACQMQEIHGLQVTIEKEGDCRIAHRNLRVLIFQVVRELLFNVVKHARTNQSTVTLRQLGDQLFIAVADSGQGFDLSSLNLSQNSQRGFGLHSIRERLDLFDGRLEVQSAPGQGTKVSLSILLPSVEDTVQQASLFADEEIEDIDGAVD